jgi:3-phosphoshikimate 1-carboxyvinyltransferase
MTNRALVISALADEPATLIRPLRARDTSLMVGALRALGAAIDDTEDQAWTVRPALAPSADTRAGLPQRGSATVDVGNAGTVIRFVPPVASLTALDVLFHGDLRAAARPAAPLLAGLRDLGAEVDDDGRGAVPFTVHGHGFVGGGVTTLDASSSSQLISGLLLSAPRFAKGAEVRHHGPRIPSAPHIAMTVAMLRAAGATVEEDGLPEGRHQRGEPAPVRWRVHPGPLRGGMIEVEPDLSAAVPFLAAALVTGGEVTVAGWPPQTTQPAARILGLLAEMGGTCERVPAGMRVTGSGTIHGISADLGDVSEAVPVLTALAALADSPSEFTGIGHMRGHETDRLAALAREIGALGGEVTELSSGLAVRPRPLRPGPVPFDSHDDHRLVMAAAVLGLATGGIEVANAATVAKTFPGFTGLWAAMLESS